MKDDIDDDEITGIEIVSVTTPEEKERIRRIREKENKERRPNPSEKFITPWSTKEEKERFAREFAKPLKTKFSEYKRRISELTEGVN